MNLTGEGYDAEYPQVALDGQGDPTVVWTHILAPLYFVQYASGTPSGTFSAPQTLAFEAGYVSIAEDSAGDALIGYTSECGQ